MKIDWRCSRCGSTLKAHLRGTPSLTQIVHARLLEVWSVDHNKAKDSKCLGTQLAGKVKT